MDHRTLDAHPSPCARSGRPLPPSTDPTGIVVRLSIESPVSEAPSGSKASAPLGGQLAGGIRVLGVGVYASYLIAMPGELLAKIYGLYGPRLLEQNVRTFLQARTKVNRGIIETISQTPEMFFAYNNGLTATASELNTARLPDGTTTISRIKNLQIVNGARPLRRFSTRRIRITRIFGTSTCR